MWGGEKGNMKCRDVSISDKVSSIIKLRIPFSRQAEIVYNFSSVYNTYSVHVLIL